MIKIYPTLIDSYQYFLDSEMSLQDMIDRINRVERPISEAALRGSALNNLIDKFFDGDGCNVSTIKDVKHYVHDYEGKKYYFPVDICNRLYNRVSGSLSQVRVNKEIQTSYGPVLLYGYLDYLNKDKITDLKTTARYTFPKYQKNFQHKSYLYCLQDMGITKFEYLVTDLNSIYIEKYDWDSYAIEGLKTQLEGFLSFVDKHRDLITDEKILGV